MAQKMFLAKCSVQLNSLRTKTSQKVSELRSRQYSKNSICPEQSIATLFELGGIISGGAALAWHFGRRIKDFDFYFNDEDAYMKALEFANNRFDICWYFEQPHELHDMSIVMCNLYGDGTLEVTTQAAEALNNGVSELYIENVIWPERTARRMMKYNAKYGCKFKLQQVLAFCAMWGINSEQLIKISV